MMPPEPELNRQNYVRSTARSLWDSLPLVILAGLIFSLTAMPALLTLYAGYLFAAIIVAVLMAAPGWAALLTLEADILRDAKTGIGVMLRAFARCWSRSVQLGLLVAAPLSAFLAALPLLGRPQVSPGVWLVLTVTIFCLFLAAALSLYSFPLLVLHDLSAGLSVRNGYLLAVRHVGDTAGLLSMGVLFGLAVANISLGLLLFLPAVWALFIVNYCRMAVSEEMAGE